MNNKLLAVKPDSLDYGPSNDVSVAYSFEEAMQMIQLAEETGKPFDSFDLPVYDERAFWAFVEWMEQTHRKYPFSIFGYRNDLHFIHIRDKVRNRGFHFNS